MLRIGLPGVLALAHCTDVDGDLVVVGPDGGDEFVVVWVTETGVRVVDLDVTLSEAQRYANPTVVAHPDGGVVVLAGVDRAVFVAGPDAAPVPLRVTGLDRLATVRPLPLMHGGSAVSDSPVWHLVLSHGNLMGDLRYAAPLRVDLAERAVHWEAAPWQLAPDDFPVDLAGIPERDPHVSLSATLLRAGVRYVCSEGSRIRNNIGSGADFFGCVTLAADGTVAEWIHQAAGWRQISGKWAIRGRFTGCGEYVLLASVFRRLWNGRTRVLRLADGELLTPRLPRGLTTAEILDHHPDRGWWLRLDDEVVAVPDIVG
ncbi:hypothetical protein [Micromonospora sp. NPDC003241]